MNNTKAQLAFGALLHDVGKVVYRGSSARGTHSKLGADFIKDEVAAAREDGDPWRGAVCEQVRYHHAKELSGAHLQADSLAYITYFADNISARMDRKPNDLYEGEDGDAAAGFDKAAKLRKIFNILNGRDDDNTIDLDYYNERLDDYNSVRERIKSGLSGLDVDAKYVNSVLNLLEATCAGVPSSTKLSELIDVSLFDHSKTTAGLACCIFDWLAEQGITDYKDALFDAQRSPRYYSEPMFLLYSCDMSGIQNFIYTISGEGALKQLRARSLYLEMLLEHIADELLERLELSRCNLLYTGGGHAYLLLPNTTAAKETLAVFEAELKAWFVKNYKTDLYLASAFVECSADDLSNKGEDKNRYRNLYRSLSEQLSLAKVSRYTAAEITALNFADDAVQDHSRECTECQRSDLRLSDGKCTLCAALGSISPDLINKDVFVVATNEVVSGDKPLPLPFGACLSIYSVKEYLGAHIEARRVYTKNRWDIGVDLATHIWMGDYTADTPRDKDGEFQGIGAYANDGITLDADADGKKLGIERLGVLRADVDNLGTVFSSGLPESKVSISRTSTLSRDLSYFFKYRINKVLEKGPYKAQIIYSGGDDLFVIGNWSDIIQAAVDIRKALDEFTGNGVLTISAGIGMYDSRYPIARMAAEVGELEDAAKLYRGSVAQHGGTPAKNAVALWSNDTIFGWDDFINNILGEKLTFVKQVFYENEKGKSFIYKMIALLRQHEDRISVPRLAYLLARSFEDKGTAGEQASRTLFEWANDSQEQRFLIAALELYVYGIRERG